MQRAQRMFATTSIALAAAFVGGANGAPAESERCRTDALDKWYCASDPHGTAVVDQLGRVVCAPGGCAKVDERGWLCSTVPGGKASLSPTGPTCDGECRAPEATACEKM
jgi:hypothetical protein